ncbi:MAG: energy transducer TonB [Candidatus Accumulibacter sp.]|nr:energy transducer TonB [Accumulibacter sp.]
MNSSSLSCDVIWQEDRNLVIGLAVSFLLHALLLSLHFQFPEVSRAIGNKALDIILVNSKSATRPKDPQALAQNDLDGGGNSDRDVRVSSPLPYSDREQDGDSLEQQTRRQMQVESMRQQHMLSEKGKKKLRRQTGNSLQPNSERNSGSPDGLDLADRAIAMARLQGEIARETQEYNSRPRKKFVGLRAASIPEAQYVEGWRMKIESIGTLNYPAAAKGRLYGSPKVSVTIKGDGQLASVTIDKSSGHKILDEAAIRIVRMAAPFAPLTPEVLTDSDGRIKDELVITRVWNFTNSDQMGVGRH